MFFLQLCNGGLFAFTTDSIAPVVVAPPEDFSIECDLDIDQALLNWYNDYAGMNAIDNSGNVDYAAIQDFDQVLLDFEASKDTLCGTTARVEVAFYAFDACANASDTLSAFFDVVDTESPRITFPALNAIYDCDFGIRDSLFQWIETRGGAMAEEDCDTILYWVNYFWNDNQGNSGFADFGDTTSLGIGRGMCDWAVTVSFFVSDACGNANVSNASFQLSGDDHPPIVESGPSDTTINCSALPYLETPVFLDGCDGIIGSTLEETDTRSMDSLDCGFYNFEIDRIWTATDACGNSNSFQQIITVRDTTNPTAVFEDFVLIDCEAEIDTDYELVIEIDDDCSGVNVEFEDINSITLICQAQFDRIWTATDACGNSNTFVQRIQLQDFEAPQVITPAEDLSIDCDADLDIQQMFDQWIENRGGIEMEDGCSVFTIFPLTPGEYSLTDPGSIRQGDEAELQMAACLPTNQGIIFSQEVHFVSIDSCDNAIFDAALFTIIDSIPPEIISCPDDTTFELQSDDCETTVVLSHPTASDICNETQATELEYSLSIDNEPAINFESTTIELVLEVGVHQVKYFVKDCANNISECEHVIEVIDRVPPSLSCPADITLISEPDACQAAFLLPTDYVLVENCETESYSVTEPEDEGFISFGIINTTTGLRAANSIFLQYNNTFPQGNLADPKMTIVAQGDLDDPEEYFTLFSESGQSLGQLNFQGANCDQAALLTINFDVADFTTWASDGQIFFTLVPNNDDPEKITNCGMAAFNSTDGVSFLRATVSYDDVFPNYEMRNLDGNTLVAISSPQDTAQLSIGNYEVEYSFTDATGNRDSCVFRVDVLDNTAPEISCSSIDTILVLPMVSGFMSYELDDFNITSQDNCGIANISIDPPTVSCSDAAEAQQLNLIAEDIHGNTNSCSTEVQVRLVELSPSFSSGLCVDDTLQLFANVNLFDPTAVLEYAWTGPDDFASSEMDPILLDINPMSTGTYHLELTDGNGCVFNGSVDVEVQALNSPEIFSDASVICEGEDILLNSTSFIESVNYLWYEGISPNGVLLTITPGPSFQVVNPTPGEHFYYVDIVGENCNTNESSTLQITVEALPSAQVANPFITVCEGEEIVLSSPVTDNDLEYFWSGPGGYESTGQFPELITNVDLVNQGSYSLVISKNGCVSDTAYSQVVVFPKPAQPIISGASVFCEGTNFVLSVNNVPNADNYQWYLDGVLYSNIGSNNLLIPAAQANLSGAWTVIVEAGICQSESSEEFEVLVNPLLTIGASNNGPICQGENVTLSASFIPNANYSWTSPSGLMYDGRVVEVLAEQGLYTVNVTTSSNCVSTASTIVELSSVPSITALSNSAIPCMSPDNNVSLIPTVFPSGNYNYTWTGPNNFSSNLESPTLQNIDIDANGIYTLVIDDGLCFSAPASTTINIGIIPEQADIEIVGIPCLGADISIEVTVAEPGTYTYVWTTPQGTITTTEPILLLEDISNIDNGQYTIQIEVDGCISVASDPASLTVLSGIASPLIMGTDKVCLGESIELSATEIMGANYLWIGPAGAIQESSNVLIVPNADLSDQGDYSVSIQLDGCESQLSSNFNVEVVEIVDAPSFVEQEISICFMAGDMIEICVNDNLLPGEEIQLYNEESMQLLLTSNDQCFELPLSSMNPTDTLELLVTKSFDGCVSAFSLPLDLILYESPNQFAQFIEDEKSICGKDNVELILDEGAEFASQWESNDPTAELTVTEEGIILDNITEDMFQLYITSSFGECIAYATDTLDVVIIREALAMSDQATTAFAELVEIDVLANDDYLDNIVFGLVSEPENGTAEFVNDLLEYTPDRDFVGEDIFEYEICLEDCPEICSVATVSITVGDLEDCFVGNLITPNGDGINDALTIPCLSSGNYEGNEIIIFNEWGSEVYRASPYLNDWQGTFNGDPLPTGTYFYQLDFGGVKPASSGFIVIER